MKPLKISNCVICNKKYTAKTRNYAATCSWNCGMERMRAAATQIHLRKGPYYEKHLRRNIPTEKQAKQWAERYKKGMLRIAIRQNTP